MVRRAQPSALAVLVAGCGIWSDVVGVGLSKLADSVSGRSRWWIFENI